MLTFCKCTASTNVRKDHNTEAFRRTETTMVLKVDGGALNETFSENTHDAHQTSIINDWKVILVKVSDELTIQPNASCRRGMRSRPLGNRRGSALLTKRKRVDYSKVKKRHACW